jgi:hypothetical protein
MKFKSNPLNLAAGFVPFLIAVCGFCAALLLAEDIDNYRAAVIGIASVIFAVGVYICFFRGNITALVGTDAVRFFRFGKEYLNFPYSGFQFTSYVVKHTYNGIPASSSRYLQVIPLNGGKSKNYKCTGFDKSTFEMFLSYIKSALNSKNSVEISYAEGTALEFRINKQALVRKYAKVFGLVIALIFLISSVFIYAFQYVNSPVFIFTFAGCAAVVIISVLLKYGLPVYCVKKNTPEVITLYRDRLAIGEKFIEFASIELIKLTPPSYMPDVTESFGILTRKLTVIYGGKSYNFILDIKEYSKKSVSAFSGYEEFFAVLENIFSGHPEKFVRDLG